MRESNSSKIFRSVLIVVSALALAACNRGGPTSDSGPMSGKISIDGSATVLPLNQAMATAFNESNPGVQFTVDFSGTGGGFRKFCEGQVDITAASRPIKSAEGAQCSAKRIAYIEVPAAEGKITQWKQVRDAFPTQPLVLFGPGKDSGTFDYFTFAIIGTEASSRSDYAKSEDDAVIEQGVAGEPNALGYFGNVYYQANKDQLKVVAVDAGHGCIKPSAASVADSTYQPLTRPLFVYVNLAAATRHEVNAFIQFYLSPDNTKYVAAVGYVPLPNRALLAQVARFQKGVTGSARGGRGSVTGVPLTSFDDDERDRMRSALAQ